MTTAQTPSEQVWQLSCALEIAAALPDMPQVTIPRIDALEAAAALQRLERENDRLRTERHIALCKVEALEPELRRLQAENERLRAAERTLQRLGYQDRGGQEWAPPIGQAPDFDLIDSLRSRIAELEARKPLPLSDEQIDAIADGMPGGLGGFMKTWGWRQFARKILDLRTPPTWEPQFDCMAPGQEELAVQFCAEIAGPRGQPGRNPDPVRLLEMAQALYKAEADAQLVDKSPNLQEPLVDRTANLQDRPASLIASREVAADGPVRVTRLHLTEEGRAALTSKATGPLPGITGGSS